jgi:putative two-component system response regulator
MISNTHILIVDDVPENIKVAMNLLKEDGYQFSYASDGTKALELIEKNGQDFDLILLDVMMPEIDGFSVCEKIKQSVFADIPIIFLTARSDIESISRGFEVGGVDYLTKPFHGSELLARVRTHIELYQAKKYLQRENIILEKKVILTKSRLLTELEDNQKELIWILSELLESVSDETGKHVKRVSELCALFARKHPSLNEEDAVMLFHAAPMHDLGKITIPHEVLHKPGAYTEEEMDIMKSHTTNAYNLLANSKRRLTKAAAIIAHEHHEKWDGSGYPKGLSGHDIHIYGRIVAIADVFDALTHKRCYKDAWPVDESVKYLNEGSGKHFDPELVQILNDNLKEFVAIVTEE